MDIYLNTYLLVLSSLSFTGKMLYSFITYRSPLCMHEFVCIMNHRVLNCIVSFAFYLNTKRTPTYTNCNGYLCFVVNG